MDEINCEGMSAERLGEIRKEIDRLRKVDRERIEQLEQALDHLLEVVDTIESQGILWQEWFREVVEEARRVQAAGEQQPATI